MKAAGELGPLTAEGIVGATFGVIHARLLEDSSEPLTGLLNGLMATIVLPYRGRGVAARELRRPVRKIDHLGKAGQDFGTADMPAQAGRSSRTSWSRVRLTVRTQMVLAAIAQLESRGVNPSNREVSEEVGIADQGQISRLMMRLEEQQLVENGHGTGNAKAWRLTPHGEAALGAIEHAHATAGDLQPPDVGAPASPSESVNVGRLQRKPRGRTRS